MPKARVAVPDAARHLDHYFGNWGTALSINLEGMLRSVPSAKPLFELEVAEAKAFVEQLDPGTHSITSTRLAQGYNQQSESMNWDGGKKVDLFGVTITDEFMGEFHRQGLAKEFDCFGSVRRQLSWQHGQPIPKPQLEAPSIR